MSGEVQTAREGGRVLLTKAEAAALCSLGVSTFDRYRWMGWVPRPVVIGNVIRWRASELQEWVEAGCPRPAG